MIIMIDGPEKSGKTTLCTLMKAEAEKQKWHVVWAHMKRPEPVDHNAYLPLLLLGCRFDTLVIFDRSWISELVYNDLLSRTDTDLHFARVSLFQHVINEVGTAIILTEDPETLESLRSEDDHKISAEDEVREYLKYAKLYYMQIIQKGDFSAVVEDTFSYLKRLHQMSADDQGRINNLAKVLHSQIMA